MDCRNCGRNLAELGMSYYLGKQFIEGELYLDLYNCECGDTFAMCPDHLKAKFDAYKKGDREDGNDLH